MSAGSSPMAATLASKALARVLQLYPQARLRVMEGRRPCWCRWCETRRSIWRLSSRCRPQSGPDSCSARFTSTGWPSSAAPPIPWRRQSHCGRWPVRGGLA